MGGQAAGGVARVHPCLLDVLHDAADHHVAAGISQAVDVDLSRVLGGGGRGGVEGVFN